METTNLSQFFRNQRQAKKLSVRKLAKLSGVYPGVITNFETKAIDMTISNFCKLVNALELVSQLTNPEFEKMCAGFIIKQYVKKNNLPKEELAEIDKTWKKYL